MVVAYFLGHPVYGRPNKNERRIALT